VATWFPLGSVSGSSSMNMDRLFFGGRASLWMWVLWLVLAFGASGSRAETPSLVAVMPFDGREQAGPPQKPIEPSFTASVVYEALAKKSAGRPYRLLSPDLWTGMARVKNRGKRNDIPGVAKWLSARLVLGGELVAQKGPQATAPYVLNIRVYASDGKQLGQLAFEVDRPLLQPAWFETKVSSVQLLVEQSLLQAPLISVSAPAASGTPASGGTKAVQQAEDAEPVRFDSSEAKPSLVPLTQEAKELLLRRPPWQAAFDIQFGYLYSTRLLTNENSDLRFGRSGAHGFGIAAEVHPFALVPNANMWLAGLGIRGQLVLPFWTPIAHVAAQGQTESGEYTATESRYDIALREHVNPWNGVLRPDFAVELLFGQHSFFTEAKRNIDYLRIPPSEYRYVGGALHVRMFFTRRFQMGVGGMATKLLQLGLMSRPGTENGDMVGARNHNNFQSYGEGSGFQWRLEGGAQVDVYRGLSLGARVFWEQYRLAFLGEGNILDRSGVPVKSVTDEYLGAMFTVGYVFQPKIRTVTP